MCSHEQPSLRTVGARWSDLRIRVLKPGQRLALDILGLLELCPGAGRQVEAPKGVEGVGAFVVSAGAAGCARGRGGGRENTR